jgi:hypothetical protein
MFTWYYLSSPPQILRGPGVDLEIGGLAYATRRLGAAVLERRVSIPVPFLEVYSLNPEAPPPPEAGSGTPRAQFRPKGPPMAPGSCGGGPHRPQGAT